MDRIYEKYIWPYILIPALFSAFGGVVTGDRDPGNFLFAWVFGTCLMLLGVAASKRARRWGALMGTTWFAAASLAVVVSIIGAVIALWKLMVPLSLFGACIVPTVIAVIILFHRHFLASEEMTRHGTEPVFFSLRGKLFSLDITKTA